MKVVGIKKVEDSNIKVDAMLPNNRLGPYEKKKFVYTRLKNTNFGTFFIRVAGYFVPSKLFLPSI